MESLTASPAVSVSPPAMALRLLSDERLARWAAKGSEAAFSVIFERHHQALHRYCYSLVGNGHDAADALQNTMLKALRALPGETREIALKPWLYRIAHNESISLLRDRRPDSNLDAAAHLSDPATEALAGSRERLHELTADLHELTEKQRGALLMRELGGLAFADVAGALQVSPTAAKQSVYEARCALQEMQAGRSTDCDVIRRTLSDGDRRSLRAMKIRGHLRACTGCRNFEQALNRRPAQLAALAPPLPLAMAASILNGLLGGAGSGGGTGGGLLSGLGIGGAAVAGKVATFAVVTSTIVGGAVATLPALDTPSPPDRATTAPATSAIARAAALRLSRAPTATLQSEAARARLAAAIAEATAAADNGALNDAPDTTAQSPSPTAAGQQATNPGPDTAVRPSRPQQASAAPTAPRDGAGQNTADRPLRPPQTSAAPTAPRDGQTTSGGVPASRPTPTQAQSQSAVADTPAATPTTPIAAPVPTGSTPALPLVTTAVELAPVTSTTAIPTRPR